MKNTLYGMWDSVSSFLWFSPEKENDVNLDYISFSCKLNK